ncbi:hypothetical protein ES708_05982 [subsurface metagenome]
MRKKYISEEDVENIARFVKLGASWLKIQTETGIPRRSAKRAYEEYMRSKSSNDLKAARQQVASEQFNAHMRDVISLAQSLVSSIGEPTVRDTRTSEKVLDGILEIDIRAHKIKNPLTGKTNVSKELVVRQNKILLQSLKAHTREKVDWEILDEWGNNRNIWISGKTTLKKEAGEIINNLIQGDQFGKIIKDNITLINISEIADGIVAATIGAILNGEINKAEYLIQLLPDERGVILTFSGDISGKLQRYESQELAGKVCDLARQAIRNLRAGKDSVIIQMTNSLEIMRNKKSELEDILEELRLIPLILRTKCDICPAL